MTPYHSSYLQPNPGVRSGQGNTSASTLTTWRWWPCCSGDQLNIYHPLMHLLHCVSLFSAFYGFYLSARHVPMGLLMHCLVTRQLMSPPPPDRLCRLLISERPDWGSQSWTELLASCLTVGPMRLEKYYTC